MEGWQALRRRFEELLDVTGTTGLRLVMGALAVGVTIGGVWWAMLQEPVPAQVALPLLDPASITTTSSPEPVVVHVAGSVADPGVRVLPAGARVVDAVAAAGGAAADADLGRMNLAARVVDGQRIYVPAEGEAVPEPADGASGSADGVVDVNTADAATLETLPGVGPATAAAIIEHRNRHGPFETVEDLLDVPGIGEAKLAALRDRVRV